MKKLDIVICQQEALNRNGKLISEVYINTRTKLIWQCEHGHQWEARWNSIKQGQWCPNCNKKPKPTIIELQQYAINKNGKLLSTEYKNNLSKLEWQCKNKHQWKASWNSIKDQHSWCPKCVECAKPEIVELQQYAMNKNGKLLSNKYKNNYHKLKWQCKNGHQWKACWNSIKSNRWCPFCSLYKSEKECIKIAEEIFNFKFIKCRIFFDKDNKHKYLEFDGYNKKYNIAIEYNGYQHYVFPNHFHKSKQQFEKQQQLDELKKQYCKEHNIYLLEIPYTEQQTMYSFIKNKYENYFN